MGLVTAFGGYETSQGYGGWGPNAEGKLKFPPNSARLRRSRNLDNEEEEEKKEER